VTGVSIELPHEVLAQLVDQVVAKVRAELDTASPWLDRRAAAVYLSMPLSALEKRRDIPCHRVGARVFYDRRELDGWMRDR
jgi:predicted ATPase